MKFRKRITIIPGVRLNLSGSGVSVTAGIPGLSVNVGKRGAYLNTGLPGSGLYERTRLDRAPSGSGRGSVGGATSRGAAGARDTSGSRGASIASSTTGADSDITASLLDYTGDELVAGLSLVFRVTEDGTVGTFLPEGDEVVDPRILRKVRRSAAFRAAAQELRASFLEECEREMAAILEVHHRTPAPLTAEVMAERRRAPAPPVLNPRPFETPVPTEEHFAADVAAAARREVRRWPLWSLGKRRHAYYTTHIVRRVESARRQWEADREQFERAEEVRVARENRRRAEAHAARMAHLDGVANGDPEAVGAELEQLLAPVSYPLPFDIEYTVDDDATVQFTVDVPEIEDLPAETARLLSSGKLSVKSKSERQQEREYATAVAALALFVAGHAFAASPAVTAARVTGITQRIDPATGREMDVVAVDVTFDRARFVGLRLEAGEPVAMVIGFNPAVAPGAVH